MTSSSNHTIRHQQREKIITDHTTFHNINCVSISTLCCILPQHQLTMKQLYRAPFERNCVRVKDLHYNCVSVSVTVLYCNAVMAEDQFCCHCIDTDIDS